MNSLRGSSTIMRSIILITILYFIVWWAYFYIFADLRLLRGYGSDDWFSIWSHKYFGIWLGVLIRYGLFVPLICASIFGVITSQEKLLKTIPALLVVVATFVVISTGFEFVFQHGHVVWWKFYVCVFPPICLVGSAIGRLLRKFVFIK
jgi:hypothetical protein